MFRALTAWIACAASSTAFNFFDKHPSPHGPWTVDNQTRFIVRSPVRSLEPPKPTLAPPSTGVASSGAARRPRASGTPRRRPHCPAGALDAALGHALHHGGTAAAPAGLRLRGGLLRARPERRPRGVGARAPYVLWARRLRARRALPRPRRAAEAAERRRHGRAGARRPLQPDVRLGPLRGDREQARAPRRPPRAQGCEAHGRERVPEPRRRGLPQRASYKEGRGEGAEDCPPQEDLAGPVAAAPIPEPRRRLRGARRRRGRRAPAHF
mmetsp:Transcript_22208/g.71894  ORF Transcript_22208/g.71894 Transcript_22208/m.71894 type:complete len:268 (-) Transcript_22208:168-971(-)